MTDLDIQMNCPQGGIGDLMKQPQALNPLTLVKGGFVQLNRQNQVPVLGCPVKYLVLLCVADIGSTP